MPPAPPSKQKQPTIGIISLGCPKALVDSERILTKLRADGYAFTPHYDEADAVIVNTCGFLDSARAESLEAIGEAMHENGRVIVTGCLGVEKERIEAAHPGVLGITGPHQYEAVVQAVHAAVPPSPDPYGDLVPAQAVRLTPRHYAYLKISEGCSNKCSFCIIPQLRGALRSRPAASVLYEAERLVAAGVRELLVISQDTSAYGRDLRYAQSPFHGTPIAARFYDLVEALGQMGVWVRLHYVYPYPHVDAVIPLMADGAVLPYLDIPFQHASTRILKAMRRPADQEKMLQRIASWRAICPDLAIRSSFIVGFPGETDDDFETLLAFLREAQLERVGCFEYEDVAGAASNALGNAVPAEVRHERWHALMAQQARISSAVMQRKVGRTTQVLIDEIDTDQDTAVGRTKWDAPEIDGHIIIDNKAALSPGDLVSARVTHAQAYDLVGEYISHM